MWGGAGNCDERKRVKELKMGWRSTRVTMVNILSWALINTFMVLSVRASQDQTPNYEELGETTKILHSTSLFLNVGFCPFCLYVLKTATLQANEGKKNKYISTFAQDF